MSNWLEKIVPSIVRSEQKRRSTVPEGLWQKCPKCEGVLYRPDLENNHDVCPKCNYHMRIGARRRLELFLDKEGREEIGAELELPSDVEEDDVDQKKSKQSDKTVTEVEEIDSLENKADDAFEIEEADLDIIKDDIDEKDLDKAGSVDLDEDVDDMDFLGDTDESATKIELAKAYIDMNDTEAALDMLNEVIEEGSDAQKEEARQLLDQIS